MTSGFWTLLRWELRRWIEHRIYVNLDGCIWSRIDIYRCAWNLLSVFCRGAASPTQLSRSNEYSQKSYHTSNFELSGCGDISFQSPSLGAGPPLTEVHI